MIVMSGVLTMPKFLKEFRIDYSAYLFVVIITLFSAGAFGGALLSGPMADALGRKGLAAIGTLSCILGDLLLVTADATSKIYAGRVVTGIGVGCEGSSNIRSSRLFDIQQLFSFPLLACFLWLFLCVSKLSRLPLCLLKDVDMIQISRKSRLHCDEAEWYRFSSCLSCLVCRLRPGSRTSILVPNGGMCSLQLVPVQRMIDWLYIRIRL